MGHVHIHEIMFWPLHMSDHNCITWDMASFTEELTAFSYFPSPPPFFFFKKNEILEGTLKIMWFKFVDEDSEIREVE